MSDRVTGLVSQFAALTNEERKEFIARVLGDEDEELTQDEWDAAWADEINRRMADIDAGRARLIPADEVMARLREKYG